MSKLDELIDLFNNDSVVKNFKELEEFINNNEIYKIKLNEIKELQKTYLKNNLNSTKKLLEDKRNEFLNDINIRNYLIYVEDINQKVQIVTKIINDEINVES